MSPSLDIIYYKYRISKLDVFLRTRFLSEKAAEIFFIPGPVFVLLVYSLSLF